MKMESVAIFILAGLLVVSFMIYAGSWVYSNWQPVIEYGQHNSIIPPVVDSPSTVRLCRNFTFNRAADLHISRYLVKQDGNITRSVDVGSTIVHREPGKMSQCRDIRIPECIDPGEWIFRTYVTWQDWPHWDHTNQAPDIPITVRPSECSAANERPVGVP